MSADAHVVTPELIYSYFGPTLCEHIQSILIDNDIDIILNGRTRGPMTDKCVMPIKGWKNYWYGKAAVYSRLLDDLIHLSSATGIKSNIPRLETISCVVSCRFDVLGNSNSIPLKETVGFITTFFNKPPMHVRRNIMALRGEQFGADNLYGGSAITMHALAMRMHLHMDAIIHAYTSLKGTLTHQEFLVVSENDKLNCPHC